MCGDEAAGGKTSEEATAVIWWEGTWPGAGQVRLSRQI